MKKHDIKTLREQSQVDSVKIVRSPSDASEWVVLIKMLGGQSFFLISDDEEVRSYASLDTAVAELDALGFARAEVLF